MSIPFRELIDKHCGGVRGGWDRASCHTWWVVSAGLPIDECEDAHGL